MARRALLLALDNYAHARLAKLEAPRNDVANLRDRLKVLGHADTQIGLHVSSQHGALSTGTLRTKIRGFLKASQPGDELLIYLSGHGMDQDGFRLVVPVDFDMDDPMEVGQLVSDHWIYGHARNARADSVVIIADTCRSGAQLALKPATVAKSLDDGLETPVAATIPFDAPTIAMLYSCEKGQRSFATEGANGRSAFTDALCHVLDTDGAAFTLSEIVNAVTQRLTGVDLQYRQRPFVDERFNVPGRLGLPALLVIKESETARLRQRISRSPGCRLLSETPYWPQIANASAGLAVQLQVLAVRVEAMVAEAAKHLPQDRWRSDAALPRLFEGFRYLLGDASIDPPLAALLLAAPLVHEATLAGLVLRLATAGSVLDPSREHGETNAVALATRAWRRALDSGDDLERRRAHLRLAGATHEADDLLAWQLWSFAYGSGELWAYAPGKPPGASGWLNDLFDGLLSAAPMPEIGKDPRVMQLLDRRRLVRLGRLMFCEPEDIDADASRDIGGLSRKLQFGTGTELWRADEVEAAHLLSLAARLALDPRRLPILVAEQLGLGDGFDLPALHRDLQGAAWQRADTTLTLQLRTPFPATHAVLSALVEQAERHRHRLSLGGRITPSIAGRLPAAILDSGLEPETDEDNRPRFDTPHVRFTLDQHRVLRLLLGEQVYGDPVLALRELYQNAMDACRYRRARAALVARTKNRSSDYVGRIVFSAGHHDQRPFIACEDNGIGMGDRHLSDLFARAGRRFTDAHEFHLDYAQWQEAGIPFWTNSRFGIGVLSYFMLAEEILIETRRVETDGLARPDDGLEVRITGSGALFRIRRNPAVLDGKGGSRVTLLLKDSTADPNVVLRSILQWLWLPEFETTLEGRSLAGESTSEVLQPGLPTAACVQAYRGVLLPVPGTAGSLSHPRLFWAPLLSLEETQSRRPASVLVDGIRTAIDGEKKARLHDVLLANLTEDLAGEVGVDRTQVRPPTRLKEWMSRAVDEDAGHALLAWLGADPVILTRLAIDRPQPIEKLDADLRDGTIPAENAPELSIFGQKVSTCGIGLSVADAYLGGGKKSSELIDTVSLNADRPASLLDLPRAIQPLVAGRLQQLHASGARMPAPFEQLAAFIRQTGHVEPLRLCGQWPVQCAVQAEGSSIKVKKLRADHMVRIAKDHECSYAELARRIAPLASSGVLAFDPLDLARLDDAPPESRSFLERALNESFNQHVTTPLGWSEIFTARLSANQLDARLRVIRPLVALHLANARDVDQLERLVPLLKAGADAGLLLNFDPLLLLSERVTAVQLAQELSARLDGSLPPGTASEVFMPWITSGLMSCSRELIALLDSFPRDVIGLIASLSTFENDGMPSRFAILQQMLKQGCSGSEVSTHLAALRDVHLISADVDITLFVEAYLSVQRLPQLAKLVTDFDEFESSALSFMLPLGCNVVLGLSNEAIVQVMKPLEAAGIIEIAPDLLARLPQMNQGLGIMIALSDIDKERRNETLDAATLHHVSISLSIAPARVAEIVAPPLGHRLVSTDLDLFAKRPTPHRLAAMLMSLDGDGVSPWRSSLNAVELACVSYERKTPVPELAMALEDLRLCNIDVSDAVRFSDWLAANPQVVTLRTGSTS